MKIGKIQTEKVQFEDDTVQTTAGAAIPSLPVASTTVLGGIKQGINVTIAGDGTLSVPSLVNADWNSSSGPSQIFNKPSIPVAYNLPIATTSVLGGVKIGNGVSVAGDGTIAIAMTVATIVSSAGIASINWNTCQVAKITLTENITFDFTGGTDMQRYMLEIKQDATFQYTVAFPASVRYGLEFTSYTSPTLTTRDKLMFQRSVTESTYDFISISRGF
jgi:hypothetical protein